MPYMSYATLSCYSFRAWACILSVGWWLAVECRVNAADQFPWAVSGHAGLKDAVSSEVGVYKRCSHSALRPAALGTKWSG